MIVLDDVTVSFEEVTAMEGIDLSVDDGEFVTIVGPSGCGKTTILRTVGGLVEPTAGSVTVDGDPPSVAQEEAALGFVFQQHTLLPWKTALENVVFLRTMAGKPPERDEARGLLELVGLEGFEDARPSALSGG
ncbi:ATP-binding cassette domain-containing protein [Halalkalicoccus salilacus]